MGIDVYKFKGKGIMRLEEKITKEFLPPSNLNEMDELHIIDICDDLQSFGTKSLFPKNSKKSKLLKISIGVYDKSELEQNAPGCCIYISQDAIDILGIKDEEIKDIIAEALVQIITNDNKLKVAKATAEDIRKFVERHYTEIDVDGCFY